jgi:hypothetical protein
MAVIRDPNSEATESGGPVDLYFYRLREKRPKRARRRLLIQVFYRRLIGFIIAIVACLIRDRAFPIGSNDR